jgi:polyisoprenoid-binding protein YceI
MIRASRIAALAIAAALALGGAGVALAQPPSADVAGATAGNYSVDPRHTAVIARVSHFGVSYEVFRFGDVSGALTWDPANPAGDSLTTTAHTASIATPVEGFATELQGARFLNSAQFPDATFVSTAFHQTDATHGRVDGNLTLKGVTKPVTFDVTLVGAGVSHGATLLGVTAHASINSADYSLPGFISGPIELSIDAEFHKS